MSSRPRFLPRRRATAAVSAVVTAGLAAAHPAVPALARAQDTASVAASPDIGARPGSVGGGTQAARRVTLEEAVALAVRRNPGLDAVRADVGAAKADHMGTWGDFLPSLSLGYGYSRSSTGRLDPTGQTITNTSWTTQLTARYDLFSGFRRVADVGAAGDRVDAAEARLKEERYRTVLEAKSAFFGAVARRELAAVEADRVRRQEAQLDSVRLQLELGQVARTDLLRSEVALNNARLARVRAENAARAARFRLARTLGMEEPVAPVEEAGLELVDVVLNRDGLRAAALQAGPSLARARAEADAAESDVSAARSAYLPNLSVAGGFAWSNEEFPPERRSWQVYVYGSLPLFDGLDRESRLSRAGSRAARARAEVRTQELELRAAVDSAYSVIGAAREAVELASRTVELAGQELEMQQELFGLGRGSILELQEAQISLRQAGADRVQALFDYHMAVAQLEYLVGRRVTAVEGAP